MTEHGLYWCLAARQKLDTLLERSGLGPLDRANTLLGFALIELLQEHGHDGAKRQFMELARRHFDKLDNSDLEDRAAQRH